jgi:hypothetical protein
MPTVERFIGKPLTAALVEEARDCVAQLRRIAQTRREFVYEYDDDTSHHQVKAYFGTSGEALKNAAEIRQLFNDNIYHRNYLPAWVKPID